VGEKALEVSGSICCHWAGLMGVNVFESCVGVEGRGSDELAGPWVQAVSVC